MTIDIQVGKLLEALDRAGGLSEFVPQVDGISSEECLKAADRAERLNYIRARILQRTAGDILCVIADIRITSTGSAYLQEYRRRVPHGTGTEGSGHDGPLPTTPAYRRERRTRFMQALYERTGGSETKVVDGPSLGDELGWPRQETDDVLRYWEAERLIEYIAEEGAIVITHRGVVEVEEALRSPETPTEHFPANTIIIHGNVHGSQIQAGSPHAIQSLGSTSELSDDLLETFLAAIQCALASDRTTETQEIEGMIAVVQEQRRRPTPNNRLVHAVVASLQQIALGMASNGAWTAAVAAAHQIPHL